jgi:hypothetical protein
MPDDRLGRVLGITMEEREESKARGDDDRPLRGFEERYRADSGALCRLQVHRLEPSQSHRRR